MKSRALLVIATLGVVLILFGCSFSIGMFVEVSSLARIPPWPKCYLRFSPR